MRNLERKYRYQPPGSVSRNNPLPDLIPPAMLPIKLIEALRKRVYDLRRRRQLRKLLVYDDHILADIGYNRNEILRALHPPQQAQAVHPVDTSDWQHGLGSQVRRQRREAEPACASRGAATRRECIQ